MLDKLLPLAGSIIDRVIPDQEERNRAKENMARLQMEGKTRDLEVQMSAILAEANSKDKWTSRARPTFMYVMYLIFLFGIPMGILSAFNPDMAVSITKGMTTFWEAIPEKLYWLFGTVILGYTGARSFDKKKLLEHGK